MELHHDVERRLSFLNYLVCIGLLLSKKEVFQLVRRSGVPESPRGISLPEAMHRTHHQSTLDKAKTRQYW